MCRSTSRWRSGSWRSCWRAAIGATLPERPTTHSSPAWARAFRRWPDAPSPSVVASCASQRPERFCRNLNLGLDLDRDADGQFSQSDRRARVCADLWAIQLDDEIREAIDDTRHLIEAWR